MAFCSKCGAPIGEGMRFCPACGAPVIFTGKGSAQSDSGKSGMGNHKKSFYSATPPGAGQTSFDPADIAQNKVMGILAYLGILALIPLFAAKDSRYARFHTNQGLILLIFEAAISVLSWIISAIFLSAFYFWGAYRFLDLLLDLLSLGCFGLSIYGIVNAAQGKRQELPIIGRLRILDC